MSAVKSEVSGKVSRTPERNRLIEENLGLVHACANKFRGRGAEYDDLYQAGCVGLIKAADGFDSERGFMFSTYAVPAILGEIKRIFRDGGSVKVGRTQKEKALRLLAEKERLTSALGDEPTLAQLAEGAGIEAAEAAELLGAVTPPVSLTSFDEEESGKQLDIPAGETQEELTVRISLSECVDRLAEREMNVIRLRYFEGLTQTETAKRLSMSQVQVSRTEKSALKSLRKLL